MCSIAGFYQPYFSYIQTNDRTAQWTARLLSMQNSLLHRGPAEQGSQLFTHAGLAHTALFPSSPSGKQPLSKAEQERTCTIVFDGELYNASELLDLLSYYKLNWESASNAELLLNGYLAMGTHFFSQLNGTYAFALYDEGEDALYLVRDRIGAKPLFYQAHEKTLVFGSEPKALFAYGITPRLSSDGFCEVLGLGPARTPGYGVFAEMKEVLPGHYLRIAGDSVCDYCYWQLLATEHNDSYENTVEKVNWLLHDAITKQIPSDKSKPVCTFLSGGLDSSLVSAFCQRALEKEGKVLDTYSFDFVGNKDNFKPNSFQSSLDRPFADLMKDHLKTNHRYLECDSQTQADYLYKVVDARDVPCMADVESSLLFFCEQVAQNHKVALTGECADEIFGGYPWFHQKELWQHNLFPWSYDLSPRLSLLKDDFLQEHDIAGYVQNAYDTSIAETPRLSGEDAKEARRREISWLNIRWFMVTLLNRMDRTSMAAGMEARVPFADHRILQYVFNIPWDMKCHEGKTKSLLLEAGKNLLPPEVLNRKKSPYPKTYDPIYENLLKKQLLLVLAKKDSPLHYIADEEKVLRFLNTPSDYGKPWYGQLMAGPQMIAYLLQTNYWLQKYKLV